MPELDEVRRIGELAGERDDLVLTARDPGRWRLWFSNILWRSTFDSSGVPPGGVINVRHGLRDNAFRQPTLLQIDVDC